MLEAVATATRPLTVAEICEVVDLHRSITYRMLRTLAGRGLIRQDSSGRYSTGAALAVLARNVMSMLRSSAAGPLALLAEDLAMTAFLVVREVDECVTVAVYEPPLSVAHIAYRPGNRHPVDRGAPGLALLAAGAPVDAERPEAGIARRRGYATSKSEVLPGMSSVAAPIVSADGDCSGAVAVVFVGDDDRADLGDRVIRAAAEVARLLG